MPDTLALADEFDLKLKTSDVHHRGGLTFLSLAPAAAEQTSYSVLEPTESQSLFVGNSTFWVTASILCLSLKGLIADLT